MRDLMAQNAARAYWRFTVLWLIVGCSLGTLCAFSLLAPESLSAHPILSFGRLVAAHRAVMIHGTMFAGVFAAVYTLLPRLAGISPGSRPLSTALAWIGALIVLGGVIGILAGRGSGWEYADLPALFAFLFWLCLMAVAIDIGLLLARSRILTEHPAVGLLLPACLLPAVVYPFTWPDWWGIGLFGALRSWVGWRSVFLVSFAGAALGIGLWMQGTRGRRLALPRGAFFIGIALLAGLAPFSGIVHLLDAPISEGLKAWGAFAGVGAATGLILLARVIWRTPAPDPPSVLALVGIAGLTIAAVQGILMTLPPIHSAFHFTANTSAHAHLALGAVCVLFLAGALIAVPRLARRKLHGAEHVAAAAGWFIGGLLFVLLFQMAAGVVQAVAFSHGLSPPDWLSAFRWLHLGAFIGGIAAMVGAGMFGWIILSTLQVPLPGPAAGPERLPEPDEAISEGGEG